jgi:hypothetical protein
MPLFERYDQSGVQNQSISSIIPQLLIGCAKESAHDSSLSVADFRSRAIFINASGDCVYNVSNIYDNNRNKSQKRSLVPGRGALRCKLERGIHSNGWAKRSIGHIIQEINRVILCPLLRDSLYI